MNPETDSSIGLIPSASSSATADLFANPSKVLRAAGDPVRWIVLRELAAGPALSVQELARRAGRKENQMSKHMAVLRKAGVVAVVPAPDGDGRKQFHAVPETFRRTDPEGRLMLDFGVCVLRFGDEVRERVATGKD